MKWKGDLAKDQYTMVSGKTVCLARKINHLSFAEESVSVDPVKNALKLFQKWDILECHTENKLRLYYLKESQDDSECVDALYKRILKFKTELKWWEGVSDSESFFLPLHPKDVAVIILCLLELWIVIFYGK